ncbi:MAG: acyltransferase family protein [Dysgonomonas sp.]|nr:acyltransferase family protein [Dysgonomonas sp.]
MAKQRNLYADFLKGILIISVVIGHCIQYLQCENDFSLFWNHFLFKTIYTFHMPLFMGISGYFAYFSIAKHSIKSYAISRIKYLLLPLVAWCLISVLITGLNTEMSAAAFLGKFVYAVDHYYWFIWAIIYSSMMICVMQKWSIDKPWILLVLSVLIMFASTSHLSLNIGREYFIYFALGYMLGSHDLSKYYQFCRKYIYLIAVLFVVCYIIWDPNLYFSPFTIEGWLTYLFRVFSGLVASVLFLVVMYLLYGKIKERPAISYLSGIGQETLGIYLMQDLLITAYKVWIMPHVSLPLPEISYIVLALLMTGLCYLMIHLLKQNKATGFVLLGKKI